MSFSSLPSHPSAQCHPLKPHLSQAKSWAPSNSLYLLLLLPLTHSSSLPSPNATPSTLSSSTNDVVACLSLTPTPTSPLTFSDLAFSLQLLHRRMEPTTILLLRLQNLSTLLRRNVYTVGTPSSLLVFWVLKCLQNGNNDLITVTGLDDRWESQGYFRPNFDRGSDPFVVSMPPPNVTGSLHMGHAMFVTLEVLIFFKNIFSSCYLLCLNS